MELNPTHFASSEILKNEKKMKIYSTKDTLVPPIAKKTSNQFFYQIIIHDDRMSVELREIPVFRKLKELTSHSLPDIFYEIKLSDTLSLFKTSELKELNIFFTFEEALQALLDQFGKSGEN